MFAILDPFHKSHNVLDEYPTMYLVHSHGERSRLINGKVKYFVFLLFSMCTQVCLFAYR